MAGPEDLKAKNSDAAEGGKAEAGQKDSEYLSVTALGLPSRRASEARPPADGAEPTGPAAGQDTRGDSQDNQLAYLSALTGRLTYLALTGKLHVDSQSWRQALKKAGPVGEQLLERMHQLEKKGWSFGRLGFGDPYWELKGQGYASRLLRMTSLGGYHWDVHDGVLKSGKVVEGLVGLPVKRITYNPMVISAANILGYGYGTSDPIKNVATIMAHELGHEDGILREHSGDWKKLLPEEQRFLAKRMLATEARAIVTQLHVAQQLGDMHIQNTMLRSSLRGGELGGFIHDTWGKSGGKYGAFSVLDRKEAVSFVNSYLDETFGKGLIDAKTGKIRPFDINAGFGKQIGSIAGDAELAALMAENKPGVRPPSSRLAALSESATGRGLIRGAQALAAVGVLAIVNDLRGAFKESPSAGVARLARVGVDWGGFEAGTALTMMAAERAAMVVPSARFAKLLPVLAIAGGMGGSWAADRFFGSKVEKVMRSTPAFIDKKRLESWSSLV